ncbi:hypothetical protein M3Y95_00313400 [Aphelenchoides besseyi]|nr:hypothetical protein M3Y95_00313400 [Aphelenchoides besseyi]
MELLCQHQIEIKNGVFLVSAYGIEHHSPRWIVNILTTTQFSLLLLAVTIIPTQFYLRYRLLCGGANHRLHLICSLSISILASLWLGILSLINRWDAQKRGTEYYERMLGDEWRDENNKTKFLDAIDLQDRYALCYYASGTIIIAGSYSLALYFGYKSIHAVQPVPSESSGGHGKTEKLKKAFTRNLIVQAVCSYLFSVTPTGAVAVSILFKWDISGYGVYVLSLLSFCPLLNAISALALVHPYRAFLVDACFGKFKKTKTTSTVATSKVESLSHY